MPDSPSPDMSGIDPALLQDFISESQEILDGLDPLFVALESTPDDMSIVDGIFRPVHSVKGNSGFFGLTNIKNFAHVMENILGEIRARKRTATPPLIDLLLRGVDFLRSMMNRLAQGDHSGSFTPAEEMHLERLNQASSGTEDAGSSETSEAAAEALLRCYEAVSAGTAGGDGMERLGAAIRDFIHMVIPGYCTGREAGGPADVGYMIGGREVTGAVNTALQFIDGLEENRQDETRLEAFLTALEAISEVGRRQDRGVIPLVDQIKDDFLTIHEAGIGFDDMMQSLIRERFDAILGHIEKVEIGGGGEFYLGGENVSPLVRRAQQFVLGIQELEKETEPSDSFVANVSILRDMAGDNTGLLHAAEQLLDDFITIHESGIGFDDMMQSLIHERLVTLLAHLERRRAVQTAYRLGDQDVTADVRTLQRTAVSFSRLAEPGGFAAFTHALQSLAEAAELAGKTDMAGEAASLLAEAQCIEASEDGMDAQMQTLLADRLQEILDGIGAAPPDTEDGTAETPPPEAGNPAPEDASAPARPAAPASAAPETGGKTLRVAEEKVDHFMNFVGELIITGEVFAYIQKKLEQYPEVRQVAQEFKNANLAFGELSTNLQKSLMEVRRVPLKTVLQKLHRIIRDTASTLGKKIDLEIAGEEVQIDKSLLEGLESPLVHMVRNSVDHGVESPPERTAAGKPETGLVRIIAAATEEQFTLTIQDDGRGLDVGSIKSKAVARGIITEETARTMADRDAFRLIFNAGLSTARAVTDVSGRGVGMDVVLSNLTKMNGSIAVDSVPNQGSTFVITLPMTVTLTVIDGLVARIGRQFYIIPITDVRESVKPVREQVHVIRGSQEILDVRGELHPIVRLGRVLGVGAAEAEDITDATAVLVQGHRGHTAAFLVDELIGQQSVVVKDLGREFAGIRCLQGGSILGDGRVGLVLSVEGVMMDTGIAPSED